MDIRPGTCCASFPPRRRPGTRARAWVSVSLGLLTGLLQATAEERSIRPACALVIGIGEYAHWDRLPTARDDAGRLAFVLGQKYGYGDIHLLLDGRATRRAILDELQSLARLGESDGILICFVGHGARNEALDEGYWIPADARRDDDSGWIAHSDVFQTIRASKVRHVAVLSSSRIGDSFLVQNRTTTAPAAPEASGYPAMAAPQGRWIVCGAEVVPSPIHLFSLVNALLARMESGPSIVSLQELATTMQSDAARNSWATPVLHGSMRDPAHAGGAFVFARRTPETNRVGIGAGATTPASSAGTAGEATGQPAPLPAAQTPDSAARRSLRYPVCLGESIETIAKGFLLTPESLRKFNGLRADQDVAPDTILLIPMDDGPWLDAHPRPPPAPAPTVVSRGPADRSLPRIRYPVSEGETIDTIARAFQIAPADIRRFNRMADDAVPAVNSILYLPVPERESTR